MSKPQVIHRDKLFGGRETAEDVWRRTVLRGRTCDGCGAPAAIKCTTFAPFVEVFRRQGPEYLRFLARQAGDPSGMKVPLVDLDPSGTGNGPGERYVRIGTSYACEAHKSEFERAVAKSPSWMLNHFDRGPGKDKVVVGG